MPHGTPRCRHTRSVAPPPPYRSDRAACSRRSASPAAASGTEHRTAPRQENRLATGGREQAPQGKPALLRQLPLRNRDKFYQSRFRGQQIVVTRVPAPLIHVVADRQQTRRLNRTELYSMRANSRAWRPGARPPRSAARRDGWLPRSAAEAHPSTSSD